MTDLEAWNAPLVTSRDPETGAHVDHPSYVINKGRAGRKDGGRQAGRQDWAPAGGLQLLTA